VRLANISEIAGHSGPDLDLFGVNSSRFADIKLANAGKDVALWKNHGRTG